MRRLRPRPRRQVWRGGLLLSNARDPKNCAKPYQPFAIGTRKFWPSLTRLSTRLSNGFVEGKNNRTKALMRPRDVQRADSKRAVKRERERKDTGGSKSRQGFLALMINSEGRWHFMRKSGGVCQFLPGY